MLENVGKPKPKAAMITIYGDAGAGKTTLAATFPKPIFIRAEDGMRSIDNAHMPDAFDVAQSFDDVLNQIKALLQQDHDYKTLVIDTITTLENMAVKEIEDAEKKPLAQCLGGYGKGIDAVASKMKKIRNGCEMLRNQKNMIIVFLAHADVSKIDPPDGEAYTRYGLQMMKKSAEPYINQVDIVGFLKLDMHVRKEQRKAIATGNIVLDCTSSAANVSKNRFGITELLQVKQYENPLLKIINEEK